MATALKSKSFQRNLLLSIGGVFLLFAICFSVYQYKREKEYKIDILQAVAGYFAIMLYIIRWRDFECL